VIFPDLMAELRFARSIARNHPELLDAQLERVLDQVDRLLKVEGRAAEPLHATASEIALLVFELQDATPGEQTALFVRLAAAAAEVERLERMARGLLPFTLGVMPRHWLPQTLRGGARNTPFTVVEGGRR
jgi:hypothetical protein